MTPSQLMSSVIAFVIAIVAMLSAAPEGRAQTQRVIPPPLSLARAQHFRDHPGEWSSLLSRLQQRQASLPEAAAQAVSPPFGGTWSTVARTGLSSFVSLSNPLLLTDGTVIVHDAAAGDWWKLTASSTGSYQSGTWSQIASLPGGYAPLYFASAVLPDGRVIVQGGEYNGNNNNWTNLGAIYDPGVDSWTSVSPPSGASWSQIGDAQSIVLPNGTFMLASCCAGPDADALLDAATLTYTATGAPNAGDSYQDEQGYTLLPDGNVLTLDIWTDYPGWNATNAEQYSPTSGTWTSAGNTPVPLADPCGFAEIGPAITRPDGTVVAFGGNTGCNSPADPTAIYESSQETWSAGPDVPALCGSNRTTACTLADAPAALLPNGNILVAASTGGGWTSTNEYLPVTQFFEFTSATSNPANSMMAVPNPLNAKNNASYVYNLLVLPNGQILMTDLSDTARLYTPAGSPDPAWLPAITSAPSCIVPGRSYTVSGTQLNGLSQGAAYGDDVQGATNYPLVVIVNNASGKVSYARTRRFSTMSIAVGQQGSAGFELAAASEIGASTLYVVANGIASAGQPVTVSRLCPFISAVPKSGPAPLAVKFGAGDLALPMTYTINFGDGTSGGLSHILCAGAPLVGGQNGDGGIRCSGSASHTYTGPGSYTAALMAASGATLATATITVNPGPSPFSATVAGH